MLQDLKIPMTDEPFISLQSHLLTYADGHFLGDAWCFSDICFTRDDSERVTGFKLTGNRVKNLYFGKRSH